MTSRYQVLAACGVTACLASAMPLGVAGQQSAPPQHAQKVHRLMVRNAMVIYGSGRPPAGPYDIVVQDGVIAYVGPANPRLSADVTIDASGHYVMPGIVNTHMHWHEERQSGMPQPIQYERNLYLAAGITTAREVGGDFVRSKQWQSESNAHTIVSPRILVYPVVDKGQTGRPDEIRAWIRGIKDRGADGLKIISVDRDQLEAILDEAHQLGLRTTAHIGVGGIL